MIHKESSHQAKKFFQTEQPLQERQYKMFKRFTLIALTAALIFGAGSAFAQDEAEPTVTLHLTTALSPEEGVTFGFVGVGGDIDGVVNPDITVNVGDVVQITLTAGEGDPMPHDFSIEELGVQSAQVMAGGDTAETVVTFTVTEAGTYEYFCSIPGHRPGGMHGVFTVAE